MNFRALFFLVGANFLGGSSYVATAYALEIFEPLELVFWRVFLGSVLFLPCLTQGWRHLKLNFQDWLRLAAVGLLGYAAPLFMGTLGQQYSSATNASLLIGVEPLSIVIMASIFLGERLSGLNIAAILSSLFGAALIMFQGIPYIGVQIAPPGVGDILLFLHGFFWSLYTIIGKPLLARIPPMTFTAITTLFGLIGLAVWTGTSSGINWPAPHMGQALSGFAYLAVVVTFMGTLLWNKALQIVPASMLANFIFLQPLAGVLLGGFLQNDKLTTWSASGGLFILLGAYGATLKQK